MAYARGKAQAVIDVLKHEQATLGDDIRAVVVTDYEKTSVTGIADGLLDEEAGGAVAAFRALLSDQATDALDPVLVTGSTVLVDDDLAPRFLEEARTWLVERRHDVELSLRDEEGFHVLIGRGEDWSPRVYVRLITDLFQRGVTRCLVGTRGLLGEGWDAHTINVLVDLTTVTTSMSVNQLRGRSIRLDPDKPDKLADNWLDDYERFHAKHKTLFGVTDDGAIEKGVGHVHAAFTELKPEGVSEAMHLMNAEMLRRVGRREHCRRLWRIGEPFEARPTQAVEVKVSEGFSAGFPPYVGATAPWTDQSLTVAIAAAVADALRETKQIGAGRTIRATGRAGGYLRFYIADAPADEGELFTRSLHEAIGPLHRPRYVIPRDVEVLEETWLSKLAPEILARYLRRRRQRRAMLHAVPSALAKNKELADVFEKYWNMHVSPGQAVYAYHGEGERMVEEAQRAGQTPQARLHHKDVFV
jgi:hypothetical protein